MSFLQVSPPPWSKSPEAPDDGSELARTCEKLAAAILVIAECSIDILRAARGWIGGCRSRCRWNPFMAKAILRRAKWETRRLPRDRNDGF
jgi:hypothetical protein